MSAQSRDRYYWTNIHNAPQGFFGDMECMIPQPKDKGILLKDVLEKNVDEKYFLDDKKIDFILNRPKNYENKINPDKTNTLRTNYSGASSNETYVGTDSDGNYLEEEVSGCIKFGRSDEAKRIRKNSKKTHGRDYNPFQEKKITGLDFDKMNTLTTAVNKDNLIMQINPGILHDDPQCIAMRGRGDKGETEQQLEPRTDGKTNCITSVTKDNLIREVKQIGTDNKSNGGTQPYQQDRIYDSNGISPALSAGKSDLNVKIVNSRIRRLTPRECGRLQTFPEDKLNILLKSGISDSRLYKCFGNGWTVDIVSFILSHIK